MFKWLTEKCGGGWKKAARHTNLRKTKFRKVQKVFLNFESWKHSCLHSDVPYHSTETYTQKEEKGKHWYICFNGYFWTCSELKFQIQVSLELKSWQRLRASCKAKLHLLELALSQRRRALLSFWLAGLMGISWAQTGVCRADGQVWEWGGRSVCRSQGWSGLGRWALLSDSHS